MVTKQKFVVLDHGQYQHYSSVLSTIHPSWWYKGTQQVSLVKTTDQPWNYYTSRSDADKRFPSCAARTCTNEQNNYSTNDGQTNSRIEKWIFNDPNNPLCFSSISTKSAKISISKAKTACFDYLRVRQPILRWLLFYGTLVKGTSWIEQRHNGCTTSRRLQWILSLFYGYTHR